MKKIILLISLLFLTIAIYAQQNNTVDVVYLKNGSVLRGEIIEQVPNVSINLQTSDGSIFVYQTNEIEKITRETVEVEVKQRKGYIGLSLGPSFGVGYGGDLPVGVVLNLVDFGYLFSDHLGIAAKWFGTSHSEYGVSAGVGGLLGGLLVSTPVSEKINFDAKALIGGGTHVISYNGNSESSDLFFGYDIGVGLRFHTSEKFSLLLNADYIGVYDYNSINLTFGVAYRLR